MLKEKLQSEVKDALKSGNAQKRLTLGMVLSAVKIKELEKRNKLSKTEIDTVKLESQSKLSDEEIIDVLSSEVKKRKEAIDQYEKGGREELAQKERDERKVLMEYMPEQISEDMVRAEVKKAISEIGVKDIKEMGKVIGAVMSRVKGKIDGQTVSKIVKEELSS